MLAQTTPRHLSFIETGRSRPGRDLVLRLAECLDVPVRRRNLMLMAAGLPPAFPEADLQAESLQPMRMAVEAILKRHDPYPGCALDLFGQVRLANNGCRALFPTVERLTPEQTLDGMLAPGPGRLQIENWPEVAWAALDRLSRDAARTGHPRLIALAERATAHLAGEQRPATALAEGSPVLETRFRLGDQIVRTFTVVMRFEGAREINFSELRVELLFPVDGPAEAFFRGLAAKSEERPP